MGERGRERGNLEDSAVLEAVTSQWWSFSSLLPLFVGVLWLLLAVRGGVPEILVGFVPGVLLLGTGLSGLLWAVDSRTFQHMALASSLGVLLSVPAIWLFGPLTAAALGAGSAASFLATGYLALGKHRCPTGVPMPDTGPSLAARAAVNELMMCALILTSWPIVVGWSATRVRREAAEAYGLFEERGWFEDPASYHRDPPPLENPEVHYQERRGRKVECLTFESLYEPHEDEPGRERWLGYEKNRTVHAWVLRHDDERPWLICVHGIRMGTLGKCLTRFQPEYLHEELGLNLLMPVLPLHGPRDTGLVSGERTLSGDVMDTLHTGAQAVWDLRRLVSWLRVTEGAPAVGALGHSLGGYAVSLLASLEEDLDCAVAGNPAVDPSDLFWTNTLAVATHSLSAEGIRQDTFRSLLRPVSPLSLEPLVPRDRRAIFAGTVDRVITPVQAHGLWQHWDQPRIAWYEGAHQRFLRAPEGREILEETLRAAGMLPGEVREAPARRRVRPTKYGTWLPCGTAVPGPNMMPTGPAVQASGPGTVALRISASSQERNEEMTKRTLLVCLAVTVLLALTAGVALAKTIRGTNGPDNLDGTPRADEISGRDGNDDIEGRNGDDNLLGGGGRDQFSGDYGSDTAYGLAGNDTVVGGRGPKDRVAGGDGADQLIGEEMAGNAGDDKIGDPFDMYSGSPEPLGYYGSYGRTVADGGDGDDRINVVDDPDYPHTPDVVRCGPGAADEVKADPDDDVARDCETIELVGSP